MNRQKLILTILIGIFALALAYAFWATPRQQRVAATATVVRSQRRPVPANRKDAATPDDGSRVRLDLLTREKGKFPGYQRDIFNYPRVAPPPRIVKTPIAPPPPPKPVPVIEEVPLIPPAVERALARFTFLGFLLKEGERTVFLSSEGEIFVVKKGERFGRKNEFYVTDVTEAKMTILQGDDQRVITVPLVEQAPLVPAVSIRPTTPATGRESPFRRGAGFVPSAEPREEEETLSPSEWQENEEGVIPTVEDGDVNSPEEGRIMERDVLPPGGAANE